MSKTRKKTNKTKEQQSKIFDIGFKVKLSGLQSRLIFGFFILMSILLGCYYIHYSYIVNKEFGFPLDDPWIHLTFAKNLIEYGSFSYFKNEIVTAGSTSPIYTLLLAAGFLFTNNEMILSYVLGILFFAAAVFYFYKLSDVLFDKENWLAIFAAIMFLFDRWMNFISVSGMETIMYIFFLIGAYYFYQRRKAVHLGIFLGLILWGRPDGLVFILALTVDYIILIYIKKKSAKSNAEVSLFSKKELYQVSGILLIMAAAYVSMNLWLSGTLLPNTYGAKIGFYSPEFRSRQDFLKEEVWDYFSDSAYALFVAPMIFSVIAVFRDLFKGRYNKFLLPLIFIFGLIFVYWYKLPFAHRFGRYLMPIFPFYILLMVYGTRLFFYWLGSYFREKKMMNSLNLLFFIIVIIYSIFDYIAKRDLYGEQNNHISIRQVKIAKWLRDNTPGSSVIATHDVGAIGYYSGRKIVDIAGLISPEFISKLLDKNFTSMLISDLKKNNVTHLAFLKEWYQVANSTPLMTTGDNNFEIMEIYKFDPEKTHILSRTVNSMNKHALELVSQKQIQQAIAILNKAATLDPQSSITYFYLAYAYAAARDNANTEKYLLKAIEVYPDFSEANVSLIDFYRRANRLIDARKYADEFLSRNPSDTLISNIRKSLPDTMKVN